jgi:hypothetical protein
MFSSTNGISRIPVGSILQRTMPFISSDLASSFLPRMSSYRGIRVQKGLHPAQLTISENALPCQVRSYRRVFNRAESRRVAVRPNTLDKRFLGPCDEKKILVKEFSSWVIRSNRLTYIYGAYAPLS